MNKLLRKVLLVAFAVCMALGVTLTACNEPADATVAYSVTVTCGDATVLSGVSVALAQNGENKAEKTLDGGKATFELPAGSYDVVLSGVAAGYTYSPATVTAEAPNVTVALVSSAAQTVTYTVTVSCTNGDLPGGIAVQLQKDGETVYSKALVDGTASFEAEAGTYTALLTGVPSGYDYVSDATKTLTATEHTAAFTLQKRVDAVDVAVVLTLSDKDVFGADAEPSALAGANVELFLSEDAVKADATAVSGEDGKAQFQGIKPETYYLHVNGLAQGTVNVTATSTEVEKQLTIRKGMKDAPLSWTLGANSVPLTKDVLEWLNSYEEQTKREGDGFVYFTFSVEESGGYSFDSNNAHANVTSEAFSADLYGTRQHVFTQLEADTVYTFVCSAAAVDDKGDGSYTVTITKGNTDEGGGDTPTTPWEGEGTQSNPYIITTLKDQYKVSLKYENGDYVPVYFKYVETTGAKYAIYSSDEAFLLTVGNSHYGGGGDSSSQASLFETTDGGEYLLVVSADSESEADIVVNFTIGDFTGWTSKWKGSGRFQKAQPEFNVPGIDDPYIIETLIDTYEVMIGNVGTFFKYAATETKNYTIAATGDYTFSFDVRDYNGGSPEKLHTYPVDKNAVTFTLNAGTTYLFYISANYSEVQAELWSILLSFKIEEGEAVVPPPVVQGDGSEDHPYTLDPVLGEHDNVDATSDGIWYSFTATEDADYVFTLKTAGWLVVNGTDLYAVGKTVTLSVKTGRTYTLGVKTWGGADSAKVSYSVTKKSIEPDGSKERPFVLEGEFLGDHTVSVPSSVYYKATISEDMTVVITAKTALTLMIGNVYLQTATAGTEQTFTLSKGDILIKFEKTSVAEVKFTVAKKDVSSVPLPDEFKGTWKSLDGKYEMTIDSDGALTLKKDGAAVTTLVTTATGAMEGGSFYYVAFEGKQYQLKWDGVGEKALELYAKVSGSAGEYIYFAPDPLPTFALGEFAGEYTDRAGQKGTLVVSESAISWQGHTVLLVGDVTGSFSGYTKAWAAYVDSKPEIVLIQNGSFYFQYAKLYFDNKAAAVELPSTFVGKWKSLDGSYLLDITDTKTLTLTVSSTEKQFTLSSEKKGVETLYYLTVDGTKWQLAASPAGSGTLMLASDGETVYFTPDPIPAVTFRSETGTYTLVDMEEEYPADGAFAISANAITWTGHNVVVANVAQTDPELGSSYPLFVDGNPYRLANFYGQLMLIDTVEGTTYTLEEGEVEPQKITYTVTVKSADKDIFGHSLNEAAKSGVEVSLMNGEDTVETKKTGTDGKVTFQQFKANYTVKINGESHEFTQNAVTVILFGDVVYGTEEHPLELKAGSTQLPFTEDILDTYDGAYYTFTPTEAGTYVFTVSSVSVMLMLESEDDEEGVLMLSETLSGEVTLKEGISYSVMIVDGSASTCTVKIEKKTEGEIEGSGTSEDPEILKNLNQTITRHVASYNTNYYFKFTATENKILTVTAQTNCMIGGSPFTNSPINPNASATAQIEAGKTYTFWVRPAAFTSPTDMVIVFSAADAPDIPWSGTGKSASPYVLTEIGDEITVYIAASGLTYFSYTTESEVTLKFTLITNGYIELSGAKFQTGGGSSLSSATRKTDTVSVNGTLKFYVQTSNALTPPAGYVTFKIEVKRVETEVTFPEDWVGEWKFEALYSDTALTEAPDLVIGDHTVEWGEKTVKTFGEENGLYFLEIDGEEWTLKADDGTYPDTCLLLTETSTEDIYIFTVKETEPEIEGSGTETDPEILKNLNQTITRHAESSSTNYYFQFTATENQILTVTAETYCMIGGNNPFANSAINANASVSAQIVAGTTYKFWVRPASPMAPLDMVIVFSAADAPEVPDIPDIPWSGEGTQSSPYVLTEIGDEITVYIAAGGLVDFTYTTDTTTLLQFTLISNGYIGLRDSMKWKTGGGSSLNSTTRKTDTVSVNGTLKFYVQTNSSLTPPEGIVTFKIEKAVVAEDYTVTVKGADKDVYGNTLNEVPKSGVSVSLMNGEQVVETKQTGTDGTVTFTQSKGDYTVKIGEDTYTLTENAATVTILSDIVYGTKEHPLPLKLGENPIPITKELASAGGVEYSFTVTSNASYVFSGIGTGHWFNVYTDGEKFETVGGVASSPAVTLELSAGKTYRVQALYFGSTYDPYIIKIEVQAGTVEATPDEGFHFNEQFVGTWKSEDGYTISITATTFLLTEPSGVKATYTISESEPDKFLDRTYTVVWNGVTYTFKNLDDPITLTLASASGSKSFELTATEGFTVDFPEEMQGSWKCQGSEDDDEDVSNVPDLVVGENSVTWEGHDVKVIGKTSDGLTTVYILEIDGGKWFLQLSQGELNTTLELSHCKTEEGYTFANTGAQGGETD